MKTLVYGENAQALTPNSSASVSIREQEQELTASNTLIDDPVVNTASDQPGVTPQSPASETAVPEVSTPRFPSARVAPISERSDLSRLPGCFLD